MWRAGSEGTPLCDSRVRAVVAGAERERAGGSPGAGVGEGLEEAAGAPEPGAPLQAAPRADRGMKARPAPVFEVL